MCTCTIFVPAGGVMASAPAGTAPKRMCVTVIEIAAVLDPRGKIANRSGTAVGGVPGQVELAERPPLWRGETCTV